MDMISWIRYFLSDIFCKPVFICGVSGSGTTLLSGMMDQYFLNDCTLHESALLHKEKSPLKVKSLGEYGTLKNYYMNACTLFPGTDPEELRKWSLSLYLDKSKTFLIQSVFDKAPNVHLSRAEFLFQAFPNARFLVIFRKPQANVEGLKRKWSTFKNVPIEELSEFWCTLHNSFLKFVDKNSPPVIFIEYEKFVDYPKEELERIQLYFGLSFRKYINPYPDKSPIPGKGLHNVQNGKINICHLFKNSWREHLNQEEESLIARVTKRTYETLLERSRK